MAKTISADMLSDALADVLHDYGQRVKQGVSKATDDVAKDCVNELTHTSPERTGNYAKNWERKKTARGWIVHNKRYQLTHLLEDGHQNRDGSRTGGTAHIAPAADHAADTLLRKLKEACE